MQRLVRRSEARCGRAWLGGARSGGLAGVLQWWEVGLMRLVMVSGSETLGGELERMPLMMLLIRLGRSW